MGEKFCDVERERDRALGCVGQRIKRQPLYPKDSYGEMPLQ
jgi:hypothetical protein